MRADRRSEQVVGGAHVGDPVADRLVDGVLQSSAARVDLTYLRSEELHAEHVGFLPARIDGAHIDDALEPEQRARGRARDAMLPRPRLGDDAVLPHASREERLTDRAVDLVRAGVREILSLEEDACEADRAGQARRVGERRRAPDPVAQHPRELVLKLGIGTSVEPRGL